MASLAGVRALVTGGTSGLGAAMVRALLRDGASVTVAARAGGRLEDAVGAWRAQGLPAEVLALDVRDPDSAEAAAAAFRRRRIELHIVVNNAGIGMRTVNPKFMQEPQPFWAVSPDGFADVVQTNMGGYFHVARAFAPLMIEQGHGRFVNVSINHDTMHRPGFVPYGPSRAGSEALSLIMTEDLRPHGIWVNLLLPGGATDTGMISDDVPETVRRGLLSAEVMGPPIVFLASAEADGLTGQRIVARDWDHWLASFRDMN